VSKYYETRKEFLEDLLEEGLKSALGQVRLRMQDWIGMSARRLRAMDLFGAVAHDVEADLRVGVRGVK